MLFFVIITGNKKLCNINEKYKCSDKLPDLLSLNAVYKITLDNKPSYEFIDFTGAVGIWLMSHEENDEVYVQMDNWLKSCPPNTVIYENGIWTNPQGDVVYSTPDWRGASIQHSMSHVLDLLTPLHILRTCKTPTLPEV